MCACVCVNVRAHVCVRVNIDLGIVFVYIFIMPSILLRLQKLLTYFLLFKLFHVQFVSLLHFLFLYRIVEAASDSCCNLECVHCVNTQNLRELYIFEIQSLTNLYRLF